MKYVVIVGDGMAGRPLGQLGGRTTLQAARTENMDALVSQGWVGTARMVPPGFPPGSDVANLSIFGYDPAEFYTGRAPLEAGSLGIAMGPGDVVFRCNLVTLDNADPLEGAAMNDYSAGHISSEEAAELIDAVGEAFGKGGLRFFPGTSYRHLLLWPDGPAEADCTPPHDIIGRPVAEYLPRGDRADVLRKLMNDSVALLKDHPVNRRRRERGLNEASSIWLWGQGKKPLIKPFEEVFGLRGAVISAVDLTKGIGVFAGFDVIDVPGATGWIDTNYEGKAQATLSALDRVDLVYLHVEAPDEAGHSGSVENKIRAIEDFDRKIVGPVWEGLQRFDRYRVMVLPDHPTPIEIRTHSDEPVPFVIADSSRSTGLVGGRYDESIGGREGALVFNRGHELMECFVLALW